MICCALSGFEKLPWKAGQSHIEQPGGLRLDLCGIAKGFAVDWVVERLQRAGWHSACSRSAAS